MSSPRLHVPSFLTGALLVAAPLVLTSLQQRPARDGFLLTAEQREVLSHLSIVFLDDGSGNGVLKTIRLSGANLQVVNGLGATNGNPAQPLSTDPGVTHVNGLGNVIVGYNEPLNPSFAGNVRTGSHDIVTGIGSNYRSFGALVAGAFNGVIGPYSSALGGENNVVSGGHSVAVGGGNFDFLDGNTVSGSHSVVVGGAGNSAGGGEAVIVGGFRNGIAVGTIDSTIVGGLDNRVRDGGGGLPGADNATVLGGVSNEALGAGSVVVGGQSNDATGTTAVAVGGEGNVADGRASTVSGGHLRTVSVLNTSGDPTHDWVGGSLSEDD